MARKKKTKEEIKAYNVARQKTPKIQSYKRVYYQENKEEIIAATAARQKTPEGKAVHAAANAAYNKTPKGKAAREAGKVKRALWAKTPEGKAAYAAASSRRRAKRAGCVNLPIRLDILDFLKGIYDSMCGYCRNPSDTWHRDHFIPIELKGANAEYNLVLACPPCSRSKGAKDPYVWLKEKGFTFTKPDYMDKVEQSKE